MKTLTIYKNLHANQPLFFSFFLKSRIKNNVFFISDKKTTKKDALDKKSLKKRKFIKKKKYPFWQFAKKKKKKPNPRAPKIKYGILHILNNKRNIFCTLSDSKGNMRATISSGLLKVKGRKRQALHIIKATGQLIIKKIFKHKIIKLILIHKGRAYRKKKKTLLKTFSRIKKLKFVKVNRPAPKSHNGCRPSKMRRK